MVFPSFPVTVRNSKIKTNIKSHNILNNHAKALVFLSSLLSIVSLHLSHVDVSPQVAVTVSSPFMSGGDEDLCGTSDPFNFLHVIYRKLTQFMLSCLFCE